VTHTCTGIYLRDLLRFVPIEKDFGLFRPTDKAQGGTIKMFFDYKPSVASDDKAAATTPATGYTFSPATPSTPAGETTASSMAGVKSHTVSPPPPPHSPASPPLSVSIEASAPHTKPISCGM
jgi:hypothetical protein